MNKKLNIILIFSLVLVVLSIGSVSAENLQTTANGVVSGDVSVATENPWSTSGELSYNVPSDAKNIQYAGLYVDVYSGSAGTNYGAQANVSMNKGNGYEQIASEKLVSTEGSTDGKVYTINNHTTKCYSDYQCVYNITDKVAGLNGTTLKFNVTSSAIDAYSFDGRIKLIGLVLAYNDGDNDTINYWVNSGQSWTNSSASTIFNTGSVSGNISNAVLTNIALSSNDGRYQLNDKNLANGTHKSGTYYQYNKWNVLDKVIKGQNTVNYTASSGSYGPSFKSVLSVLAIDTTPLSPINATISPEYTSTCYAGTNNTMRVNLTNGNKNNNNVTVKLYADGKELASENLILLANESKIIKLTDPTIRNITENTVLANNNSKVNYTVVILNNNELKLNETSAQYTVLYNGYLGKDYEYPVSNTIVDSIYQINGDMIVATQNASTYAGATVTNRTDSWNIVLPKNSTIVDGFIYVSYNWDKTTKSTLPLWNATFNNKTISPVASYRDQSNMGTYGGYGYGLVIYNVADLIKSGENTFVLNKIVNLTAVYPSTLIALYNTSGSTKNKTVYMANNADLLANSYNYANRVVAANSQLNISQTKVTNASLYVFAAGAQTGEGNLKFNNETFTNIWNGTSNSTDMFVVDVTNSIKNTNNLSFIATGSTILALQQILVVEGSMDSSTKFIVENMTLPPASGENFTAKLIDASGNPIVGQEISFNLTNALGRSVVYWSTTNTEGIAKLPIYLAYPANYTIVAKYAGNGSYKSSSSEAAIVSIVNNATVLAVPNMNTTALSAENFTATLKDNQAKVLSGCEVRFILYNALGKNKTYWASTNTEGIAKLPINLAYPSTYYMVVDFPGNNNTAASNTVNATLIISS